MLKIQYNEVTVFPTPSAGIQSVDHTHGLSLAFGKDYEASETAVAMDGLLYHVEHGFLYAVSDSPDSIYLYSWTDGWLWTTVAIYPYSFSFDLNDWVEP